MSSEFLSHNFLNYEVNTWKWGLLTHFDNCLNKWSLTLANSAGSMTSKISSSSFRNITSFGLCTLGQYFSNPFITGSVKFGSFSRNCTTQYANWGWYTLSDLTLCKGSRTRSKNNLCSSLRGSANPLIMLPKISKSSATPLWRSVSYINLFQKKKSTVSKRWIGMVATAELLLTNARILLSTFWVPAAHITTDSHL